MTGLRIVVHAVVNAIPRYPRNFAIATAKCVPRRYLRIPDGAPWSEHVFALRQALELYYVYQAKIEECDCEREKALIRELACFLQGDPLWRDYLDRRAAYL
jgi:hypothetical protein